MHKRTWSQVLSLVPHSEGLRIARLVETSNVNTPSSPTLCVYVDTLSYPKATDNGDKRIQ